MIWAYLGAAAYMLVAVWSWFHMMTIGYQQSRTFKEKWADMVQQFKLAPDVALNLAVICLFWFGWAAAVAYWAWQDRHKL